MQITNFYNLLENIKALPDFEKFNVWLHGGIIDHPEDTTDLDVKISPRKSVTVKQIERVMHLLTAIGIEVVFMRKVGTFKGPLKPSRIVIDSDPPVLQAVYNKNLEKLITANEKMDPNYIYGGKMHYKQIGNLIFYISSEWAICGHKFNQGYKGLSEEIKKKLELDPMSKEGIRYHHVLAKKLFEGYLRIDKEWEGDIDVESDKSKEIFANANRDIINIENIEIREIEFKTSWEKFKNAYYKTRN